MLLNSDFSFLASTTKIAPAVKSGAIQFQGMERTRDEKRIGRVESFCFVFLIERKRVALREGSDVYSSLSRKRQLSRNRKKGRRDHLAARSMKLLIGLAKTFNFRENR